MKFFQQLIIIMCFFLIITGCNTSSSVPNGFYSYEKEKVDESIEQLEFTPNLPDYVPVAAEVLVTDQFEVAGVEVFDMTMFTNENDIFTIQCINGKQVDDLNTTEEISISKNINGFYQEQAYSQKLQWNNNGVSYQITYRPNDGKIPVEKLIQVAASF